MGVVPLPPPSWMNREELIEYRDYLERQRQSLPFGGGGRRMVTSIWSGRIGPGKFPSEDLVVALLILAPWILSVIVKLWIGDWQVIL